MTAKQLIQEVLASTPDDATIEDIQYRIYEREKIERGIRAIDAGDIVEHDEVERMMQSWLGESGGPGQP